MSHKPILIQQLTLSFPHKTCFENFSAQVHYGDRIAIIGKNGAGKSCLLERFCGELSAMSGEIRVPIDADLQWVPQVLTTDEPRSGGERLSAAIQQALEQGPNILLLDEPTNHLDLHHRQRLFKRLQDYAGTLIIVSHDRDLIRAQTTQLWHIHDETVTQFHGDIQDYFDAYQIKRNHLENKIEALKRAEQSMHQALMKEQTRAKNSRNKGKKSIRERKWPTVVSDAKAHRAETTHGRKKSAITGRKKIIVDQLNALPRFEHISPKFSLSAAKLQQKNILTIQDGAVSYADQSFTLNKIDIVMKAGDRLALTGSNGCGKTTLLNAILRLPSLKLKGAWIRPKADEIGYLDQHYQLLDPGSTVIAALAKQVPTWNHNALRVHLNDFLFRKNEEVFAKVSEISGGEKARLSLALIAAKTPQLLLLDEITNNLDLETKDHVIEVLKAYPGALIVISHDEDFLSQIDIHERYCFNSMTVGSDADTTSII